MSAPFLYRHRELKFSPSPGTTSFRQHFTKKLDQKNTASEVTPTWKLALSDVRKLKWRAMLCARVCEHARPRITSPTPRFKAGWQTIIHP